MPGKLRSGPSRLYQDVRCLSRRIVFRKVLGMPKNQITSHRFRTIFWCLGVLHGCLDFMIVRFQKKQRSCQKEFVLPQLGLTTSLLHGFHAYLMQRKTSWEGGALE